LVLYLQAKMSAPGLILEWNVAENARPLFALTLSLSPTPSFKSGQIPRFQFPLAEPPLF
jgi:hypothetical protein